MGSFVKHYALLLVYILIIRDNVEGKNLQTTDQSYEVLNFKIPQAVWQQALRPTPVLRSPVTIVVPVNVPQDEDNELEEDAEDEVTDNVVVDTTLVNNEQVVSGIQDQVNAPAIIGNVTQGVQDGDVQEPPQDVQGQVTRFPCSCVNGQCGCCTGAILERFNMKACGNMSFVPEDFVFDVKLSINNRTVVRRRVSASDPPPICFNPRRAPFVRVCGEISNIRIRNRNAFACFDINADIGGFPVYSASFRCFSLGSAGLQTGLKPKPVSPGPKPVNLFGNGEDNSGGSFADGAAAAGSVLGDADSLFGGSEGGLFGGGPDDGPFDAIGDAIGDFFDGRSFQ